MDILPDRLDAWRRMYTDKVRECIRLHPTQYRGISHIDPSVFATSAHNMMMAGDFQSLKISKFGWKSTAKAFGIANTHDAWCQWFAGTLTPIPIER